MTAEFPTAVHALVYLGHKGRTISSSELADNICTNPARVRKIMAKLCRAGLAKATEGRSSGYESVPKYERITLRAVAEALGEEPICVGWRSGDVERECLISSGMAEEMDKVYAKVNRRCMEELGKITVGSISREVLTRFDD
jgi:DNA-binding IscR family transcriptional regulator